MVEWTIRFWFGIASNDKASGSAHLFTYDPTKNAIIDSADVVGELERLGLKRPGERQMKIHSIQLFNSVGLGETSTHCPDCGHSTGGAPRLADRRPSSIRSCRKAIVISPSGRWMCQLATSTSPSH